MSDAIDYLTQAKSIRASLTAFLEEAEVSTQEILKTTERTARFVTGHLDRWNHLRSNVTLYRIKAERHLGDAKDAYEEKTRGYKARGLGGREGTLHYEERLEVYKTKALAEYQIFRILEKLAAELRLTERHLDNKIRWLEGMRLHIKRADDDLRYSSNKDHIG